MKILHLRLKNLNSLVGEWCIDFTHPEYESNGIFAIIGPTGAGKSTLLDAICLALYGMTPRLDKITQSSNEIMARQTGECFAEVTFETDYGKYRSTWAQQRSRKKAGGELQSAQRQIVDALTGTILESQLSRVDARIKEITGMDFRQFTRSMLLAQGSFDSFLKALPKDRASILEQITGIEIYSTLSKGVFERTKLEIERFEKLENALAAISLLSEEDEKNQALEYQEKSIESVSLDKKLQLLKEGKIWRIEMDRSTYELKNLENEWNAYLLEEKESYTDLKRLEQSLKALNFEGDFRDLRSLRNQQASDLKTLSGDIFNKDLLDKSLFEKNKMVVADLKAYESLLEEQKSEIEIIKQVREIEKEESREQESLRLLSETLVEEEKTALARQQSLENFKKKHDSDEIRLKALQSYFETHATDESLLEKFSSLKASLDLIKEKKKSLEDKAVKYRSSLDLLEESKKKVALNRKSYEDAQHNMEQIDSLLKIISDDYEVFSEGKDSLQWDEERKRQALENRIRSFEEERACLCDNNPCPLCGSLDHPYANEVLSNVTDLLNKEEEFERKYTAYLKKGKEREVAQKKHDQEFLKYAMLQRKLDELLSTQKTSDIDCTYRKTEQESLKREIEALERLLLESLSVYGIFTLANPESISEKLLQRLNEWKLQQNVKKQLEGDIQKGLLQITNLQGFIEGDTSSLKKVELAKVKKANDLELLFERRSHLFGTKNPDKEEERLNQRSESAKVNLESVKDEYKSMVHRQKSLEERILELRLITKNRALDLLSMEQKFIGQICSSGFSDEEAYERASLGLKERENLDQLKKRLEKKKLELAAHKKAVEKRILELNQESKTEETLAVLEGQIQELNQLLDATKERVVILKQGLEENEKRKKGSRDIKDMIVKQRKETDSWKGLCRLIGSGDGKKFRDIAQKMTLDLMIAHTNRQLTKMSDRYLLKQSAVSPLELEVVDNYQSSDERSVKNLSGGEGFIVSLALALGLSQMSSSKVRVDTLFLDEGFGTLDDRTLESALNTLAELHQEGKVIGLISHVAVLKERISTQIRVQPISGGRSRIEGPGCSEIKI